MEVTLDRQVLGWAGAAERRVLQSEHAGRVGATESRRERIIGERDRPLMH